MPCSLTSPFYPPSSTPTTTLFRLVASLFNHSSAPNVNFIRNFSTSTITFTTSRAVEPGDELCICYSADETKLWFLPTGERARARTPSDDGDGTERLGALVLSDDESAAERAAAEAKERARETRRQQGGSTHSAKELRKAKWRAKMEKRGGEEIHAPQPVPAGSAAVLESSFSSSSTVPGSSYTASANLFPMTERVTADLPPALHSDVNHSRHEHRGPVVVTPDLNWTDAGPSDVPEAHWGTLVRAKGPIELEEEAEDDNTAMGE